MCCLALAGSTSSSQTQGVLCMNPLSSCFPVLLWSGVIKDRLSHAYIDKANRNRSHTVLIGGVFDTHTDPMRWLGNCLSKLTLDIAVSSNGNLCVPPWCRRGLIKCIALNFTGPCSLIIAHERISAESPAASIPTNAFCVFQRQAEANGRFG